MAILRPKLQKGKRNENRKRHLLKALSFCGDSGFSVIKEGSIYVVQCGSCLCKTGATTEKEVIEYWNGRPIEDALQEENIKLRAVVNFYADIKKYREIIKGDNGEDENFMLRECGRYARNVLRQLERNRENEK